MLHEHGNFGLVPMSNTDIGKTRLESVSSDLSLSLSLSLSLLIPTWVHDADTAETRQILKKKKKDAQDFDN